LAGLNLTHSTIGVPTLSFCEILQPFPFVTVAALQFGNLNTNTSAAGDPFAGGVAGGLAVSNSRAKLLKFLLREILRGRRLENTALLASGSLAV